MNRESDSKKDIIFCLQIGCEQDTNMALYVIAMRVLLITVSIKKINRFALFRRYISAAYRLIPFSQISTIQLLPDANITGSNKSAKSVGISIFGVVFISMLIRCRGWGRAI